jgi:RNA polymerase sigma factor (sigma-70 family)
VADMGHVARTDAELVEASRRGERDAFGQLVSRYQDVICAVSYSSTGNWSLSEDVAQDTFIAAWRQLGQLRETERLRPWLCGIARNLARKARRRTVREDVREDALPETLPTLDKNPFDATAQAEVDRVVREALARIPDTYREALVLYYCENKSAREIASVLGIAEDAAMQRLSRGRRYLAEGVNELVERSLRSTRGKTDLRASVMAALPHVDTSPIPEGSSMLKIAIAATLIAAVGTTTVLAVTRNDSSPSSSASVASASTPGNPVGTSPTAGATSSHRLRTPVLPSPGTPTGRAADRDAPRVISKDTMARLAIEQGPSRGPANAPVTIVLYQDLMCQFCGKVLGTIDELWDEYPGKLRVVIKQFPVHGEAKLAAEASLAAEAQGKFWELHDAMIANQDDLSRDGIVALARTAGLDTPRLANDLDKHTYGSALATEIAAGKEIGIAATPEFLINGVEIQGAQPIESFRAAIDAALTGGAVEPIAVQRNCDSE